MKQFKGCGTALVTPFRKDGSLDEATLRKLVRRQIDAGIDFLVPCGTTGESPTLTRAEHLRVCEITVEEAAGKTPVLGGAGGYYYYVNGAGPADTGKAAEGGRGFGKKGDGAGRVTPVAARPAKKTDVRVYLTSLGTVTPVRTVTPSSAPGRSRCSSA